MKADADADSLDTSSWATLERIGRALHVRGTDVQGTLDAILITAVENIDGTDFAGVNLYRSGHFEPQVVLGQAPLALDELQKRNGTGPCIDCAREQSVIRVVDLGHDERWPEYAQHAVGLGVRSMLCVPLWVDEQRLGSVSLYSLTVDAFDERQERLANLLAIHAASAMASAQRADNLNIALANRDVIGQAKGILMERRRITADVAFELLAGTSQRLNRKLAVIARELTETGSLPE